MAPDDDSTKVKSGRRDYVVVSLAVLAVVASVVGRALAPALPGSLTGISGWIRGLNWLSSFLAQLFAFGGILLAVRLVSNAIRAADQDLLFRMAALPVTVVVGFLVMTRMRLDYSEPRSSLALALASAGLALAAAPRLVQVARTRAQGLALLVSGLSGLLHATGRGLALQANLEALPDRYALARAVETAAFAIGVLLVALGAAWLFGKSRAGVLKLLGLLGAVAIVCHAAVVGSGQDAALWQVLASRSLGYLLRDPAPFVPDFIRGGQILLQFALSFWIALDKRTSTAPAVICLCLISTGATDIPLLALALTLAALVARSEQPSVAKPRASEGPELAEKRNHG